MSEPRSCVQCGARVEATDTMCPACGERVRPLAPGGRSLQVGERSPGEERRHVTVIFADLVGNTPLAERLDPEDMRSILESVFRVIGREILKLEGTIDKYVGDAVMAVFGAPIAHEDDAVRAVTAAIAMRGAVEELSHDVEGRYGGRLALRVGVNTGEVVAGALAPSVQTAYTVVGDAVNTAQRLQAAAREGEILIGDRTRELVASVFELETRPAMIVKGKSAPLVAHAVLGRLKARATSPAVLVGRAPEREHLTSAIDRLGAGSGGVIALLGEAGIGKSRLLAEARAAARDAGATWLEGHATSFGRSLSYLPFREVLLSYAAIGEVDDDATKWTKLQRRAGEVLPDLAEEMLPYLATLVGIRPPADVAQRLRALDAEAIRRQVFRSAYAFFESIAGAGPTVLALEDWHWADRSSQQLFQHLLPLAERLLLCWTGRNDPTSAVPGTAEACARSGMRYLEVRLLPLTDAEAIQLARNLLGTATIPSQIGRTVIPRAEGNPFYVQALIRSLVDRGTLRRNTTSGPWTLGDTDVARSMPPSVQAAIAARLDTLSSAARDIARVASIIGRTFPYALLREVYEEDGLDDGLAELLTHGLLRESTQRPERELAFAHALIQEAAYAGMLLERRRELHRHVADVIRTRAGERVDDFAGVLAYHYGRAEDWEQAQAYLFAVGDQALRIAADAEAIDHYERALDAYARAFGPRWDPAQRAAVERKIGEARYRLGEFEVATRHLDRALELLDAARPRTRLGVRAAIAEELVVQIAHRMSERLARRLTAVPAHEQVLQALWTLQMVDYASDFERLAYDILHGLNLAERLPASHRTMRAYFGMTLIGHNMGLAAVGTSYARMAERLADTLGDPLARAIANASIGLDHYAIGRYAEAATALRLAAAGYQTAGDLEPWAAVMAYLNMVLATQGLLSDALPIADELERVGRTSSDRRIQAFGPHCRAYVLSWAERIEESRTEFERALAMYEAIPDHLSMLIALGQLATVLLRAGEIERASAMIDRGERLAREHRLRGWGLTPLLIAQAGALLGAAEGSAGSERASLLERAARTCTRLRAQGKLHAEALPSAHRQLGTLHWLRARPKKARESWQRSLDLAERFGAVVDALETHRTVARFTASDSEHAAADALAERLRSGLAPAAI
ncbi:MAG TPA: adenylate/guanylate cyclase domain-containing protein [Candidatus Limnocylindria bacterium]|nr:adenylate/guanylate cyclase domain-containing protein [Candidatus Limnocylindria bacterium]